MKVKKILLFSLIIFIGHILTANALTGSGSIVVTVLPSGTISATNCTIALGASSCNTTLKWSTTNPVATSAVTTPTSITVASANSSLGTSYPVAYGSRTFYLYNNAVLLSQATASATCISGTGWYDGACRAPINGGWSAWSPISCPTTCGLPASLQTRTCTNPAPLYGGTFCIGLNTSTCLATVACPVMSGTLTASSCSIATGASSCNTTLKWSTTNPVATSAVTTPTSITVASANSSLGTSYPVAYGSRTFYLYNNAVLLSQATASATCTTGVNTWNATTGKCEAIVVPSSTTGTITGTPCIISVDNSTCPSTLVWNTINPLTGITSVVKIPTTGVIVRTANSGTTTYPVPYNNRTFTLVHDGVTIGSTTPIATCVTNTHWDSSTSKCILDTPGATTTLTTTPSTIFKGRSATITWNSPLATSCTGVGDGFNVSSISGSIIVSPLINTTYTLNCSNSSGLDSKLITVKVIDLTITEQ